VLPSSLLLLFYLSAAATALLAAWLLYRFAQERRYRRQAYVAPAEAGWEARQPDPTAPLRHRLALVGDLGAVATDGSDPVLNLLQAWLREAGPESTVVVLGDNVYPTGLPAPEHAGRASAERRLNVQLDALRAYPGRVVFLSGNHDWNKGRADGYEYLLRQEAYVHAHLPAAHYLPPQGTPGPATVQLAENLLLVVLNTQWWVQHGPRPLGAAGSPAAASRAAFEELRAILSQNRHQQVVVAGHHPLYSNALHGGKFTAKQHVFPLTAVHKKAYLPLPVLGSFFPLYRKLVGAEEDMAHPRYRKMRRRLLRVLHQFPGVIYAAGHDHNLQYFPARGGHYLVSGAGSKTAFVQPGGKAGFTHEHKGFFSLDFYQNGEAWLRTLEPTPAASPEPAREAFRKLLLPATAGLAASAPAGSAE